MKADAEGLKSADFRGELYGRYVTTCDDKSYDVNGRGAQASLAWCEYKYLPILASLDKESEILDLGCGSGNMLELFRRNGFSRAEGIDISEEQVHIAVGRGLNARVADVFDFLSTSHKMYEAIIAIDFLEHFSKEELIGLLQGIYKSLRPRGLLVLQTPNGQGLFPRQVIYDDLTHLTVFTPQSLRQILRLTGFENILFEEAGPVPIKFSGKLRSGLWAVIKRIANFIRLIETGKTQDIWTENLICRCTKPL